MFNVNRATLLGNVTMDPDVRATKAGQKVTSIGFATSHRTKNEKGAIVEEPDYHRLTCFGKIAEFSEKRVKKGTPLYVEGRLHTSRFKTKDGKDASSTEVIVDRMVMLSSKKPGGVQVEA